MKKSYMCTVIGSRRREFVLIILFQLCGSKTGLFECNLFWLDQYDAINLHIGRRTSPIILRQPI